ncbi:MAG TPA: enoyl-CoA hydratase-related protein [Solirubrobacterales bacterium]|nr:enoyl-CoA hydratase-related protein [Solirubrobacterales bacterium]
MAVVTIDRPELRNALNLDVIHGLVDLAERIAGDPAIGAVVITGAGDHFCAGADISVARGNEDEAKARWFIGEFQDAFRRFTGVPQPVIAAVEGCALGGGCELALWSDLRILSETARLGVPEVKIGALPAAGGTQLLPRIAGRGVALELLLTGDPLAAERAYQLGLASSVVPAGTALEEAVAMATRLASLAPLALAAMKRAVDAAWLPLDQALEVERRLGAELFATDDRREGMAAFLEKRDPVFQGR